MILTVTLNPAIDYVVFGTRFTVGVTNRGEDILPDPGGKGINSARVARRLGCEVMATGFLGGYTGTFVQESLAAEGIAADFQPVQSPTRITVAFIDTRTGDQTKIVPHGPAISPDNAQAFFRRLEGILDARRFSVVSMNGSVGRGMSPDVYRQLAVMCAARNIPVLLDSSGPSLAAAVREPAGLFMIKPNLDEARELCGAPAGQGVPGVLAALRGMLSAVPCIALTLGADGAILLTRDKCLHGRIPAVVARNPVCAGDAFVGGFLAAYDRGPRDIVQCFRSALAAGSATASVEGLLWEPSLFTELLGRVEVREFDKW